MRSNVQYVKNIILTSIADIFDIEHSMKSQRNISALYLGNIPHGIDTEVIKSGYFKIKSKTVELNDKPLSLSDVQLFDVFDETGMLLGDNEKADSSIIISSELKKVCAEKIFGDHSDIQTIALWVALKGIYADVRKQVHLFNGSLGQELKAAMARNPNAEYKSLHEFIQSVDPSLMDEVKQYLADVVEFSQDPFSLQLSKHSLILLEQGWTNVATRPKKVIVAPPTKRLGIRRFVSEKQLARIFLLSSNDVTIINLETISQDGETSAGINYFIPDMQGKITLPPAFLDVVATSQLVGVVGRIHVYQVHFSTNKNLKVIHLPMVSGMKPKLTHAERQYLFNTAISHNDSVFSEDSLMIHGGDGSQLLSNLADHHSEGAVRRFDALKYAATLGIDKPNQWPELPKLSRYAENQPVNLVKDDRFILLRETILLLIKQKLEEATDDNCSTEIESLTLLKQLLVRVEQYDYPAPAELNVDDVSTYTDMAYFLFGRLLAKEDQALASPKIEWLISLVINPIDGFTKGGELDAIDFSAMLTGQGSLIKANLQVLALKCRNQQHKIEYVVQKLLSISRQLQRLAYRKAAASENTMPVYNVQKSIADFLLDVELKVLNSGNLRTLKQFQQIKPLCEISEYLHIFKSEQEGQLISQDYCLIENMLSSWHTIHRMILDDDNRWKAEYRQLCLGSGSVVLRKPKALEPFTDSFNKIIKNEFENEKQRLACLAHADRQMKKGMRELQGALNEWVLEQHKLKQRTIQQYDNMTSRNWGVENQTTRVVIHEPKLAIEQKLLIDSAVIAEKWVVEKNMESAEQQARVASEQRMVEVQHIGASTHAHGSFEANSISLQNIRNNTPNVIFLHISVLIELPMGTLHSPVLIEWLKITKKSNAAIILVSDQTRHEKEYEKIANYFSKYHVNVVGYLDLSLMTVETLTQAIANINQKYGVNGLDDSLLIDISRQQTNEVVGCLPTLLRRREILFHKDIPADVAQLKFFQALSHELNYFSPYIPFFKNKTNVLPLLPLLFHRISEFAETALVRDISIQDFASRVEHFYCQKLRRWGGDRLAREASPTVESVENMLLSYVRYKELQTDTANKLSFNVFHSSLGSILSDSYDDCKHLTSLERNILFDKLYEGYLKVDLTKYSDPSVWILKAFQELISESFLARYKGYRADKHGLIEQKRLGLFLHGLAFILHVRYDICNKLTTFQKNTVFDNLLEQHASEWFKEAKESNAWLLKKFDMLMADLVTEKEISTNWLKTNVAAKAQKALKDFTNAVFIQIPWLQENNPELLAENAIYLKAYFDAQCLNIRNSITLRANLNKEEQAKLHANITDVIKLLSTYTHTLAAPADIENLKGYYQELCYYLKVFFNGNKKDEIASHYRSLYFLMSLNNNPIDLVEVAHTKEYLTELSNTIVINYLISNHRALTDLFMNEVKAGMSNEYFIKNLRQEILKNKTDMVKYQKLLNRFSFDGFIQQSDNLLSMLSDDFPEHTQILSSFNKDIWEHECQADVAHFLHSKLSMQLHDLEQAFYKPIAKDVVQHYRNDINKFESALSLFNHNFGLSFYECRIQYVKIRLLKSLAESKISVEPNLVLSDEEIAHDSITVLRSLPRQLMELKVSKVFRQAFEDNCFELSIVRAHQKFEEFFRAKCLLDISNRAIKYFPKMEEELNRLDSQKSLEALLTLIISGVNKELSEEHGLKNASNIAYLLDDLLRLNIIEKSITGAGFFFSDELEQLHNTVSKHVLEQRLCFLSDPNIHMRLLGSGFGYVLRGIWSNASTLIVKQRNDLQTFLDNATSETNFSSGREQLLTETGKIIKALSKDAQQLYGLILDETEIEDELIDDMPRQDANTLAAIL